MTDRSRCIADVPRENLNGYRGSIPASQFECNSVVIGSEFSTAFSLRRRPTDFFASDREADKPDIIAPESFNVRLPNLHALAMDAIPRFTITDLATELSITPRTIRFWEDQGLIAPERESGKRVYTRRDRTRLKLALRGKRLGLSLAEIKDLINMYDAADHDDRQQLKTLLGVLAKRRDALRQQREDIEAVLGELDRFEAVCRESLGTDSTTTAGSGTEAR